MTVSELTDLSLLSALQTSQNEDVVEDTHLVMSGSHQVKFGMMKSAGMQPQSVDRSPSDLSLAKDMVCVKIR